MKRLLCLSFLVGSFAIVTGLVHGCSSPRDCATLRTCPEDVDAMADASSSQDAEPVIPTGCDLQKEPGESPDCIDSEVGIFIDPTRGDDTANGSKLNPVKTIRTALTRRGRRPRLYLCEGLYEETIVLSEPVSLYGGFTCDSWSVAKTAKTIVTPNDPAYALHVHDVNAPIVVSSISFNAQRGTSERPSSIVVFVANSKEITFRSVRITAGDGAPGTSAIAPADFSPARAMDGTSGISGGTATPNPDCPTSIGGAGGNDSTNDGTKGQVPIDPVFPTAPNFSDGAGGKGTLGCVVGGAGSYGSYGIAGTAGDGASRFGTLDESGWIGEGGQQGGRGGDGQGGGGGARVAAGGIGGSGGPGGCGGIGGAGGTAGGSSIAIVAFRSAVRLFETTIVTGSGAKGGSGANGQKAQNGSLNGGAPSVADSACAGGVGGHGGSGGGGGGGAGGISVGILYKGTAPVVDGAEKAASDAVPNFTVGKRGEGGLFGAGGLRASTNSRAGLQGMQGIDGTARAILPVP